MTNLCFSVAKYDMFSPARARKLIDDNEMKPFIDLSLLDNVSSIRDFKDHAIFVICHTSYETSLF